MADYIAIEREYGSGGRQVARALARELGIPCYGREILEEAAASLHIPTAQLERYEETTSSSFLFSVTMLGRARSADPDLLLREGHLFVAEQLAIRAMADRGPAVFLGHCAAEALRDRKGLLTVFLKAPGEERRRRIREEYGVAPEEVDRVLRRFDKKRSGYYAANTPLRWNDLTHYDVVLDTGALGIRGCTAALRALVTEAGEKGSL